jgi:hypothetical protein
MNISLAGEAGIVYRALIALNAKLRGRARVNFLAKFTTAADSAEENSVSRSPHALLLQSIESADRSSNEHDRLWLRDSDDFRNGYG